MWGDLSFDIRSFSERSFGASWGLTWEAAQELFNNTPDGVAPDGGRTETEDDLEHIELKAKHGRHLYSKDPEPVVEVPPPSAPAEVELVAAPVAPAPFYSETAKLAATTLAANLAAELELELLRRQQEDEEEMFLTLIAGSLH